MLKDKHHDWTRTSIRAAFLAAALGCVSLSAHALAPSKGYNVAVTPDGKNFKIKFASDGTPTATTANGSSGVQVTSPASFQLTPTTAIGVIATGAITGASMGGAVGAAIGALGALTVATLPGFVELFERAKHRVKPDGSIEQVDPAACTVAPCYEWQGWYSGAWYKSLEEAANNSIGKPAGCTGFSVYRKSVVSVTPPSTYSYQNAYCGTDANLGVGSQQLGTRSATPSPATYIASDTQTMIAAITANAPTQEEVQALVDANFPPEVSTPTITGPARKFTGNTVEMFSPGEKRLIEEWKNMDYSTPGEVKVQTEKKTTVTSEEKTSTTVTVNPDGSTSTATTTTPAATRTETTTDENEKPPEDPCKLFPGRVGCLDIDTPGGDIPRSTKTITFQEENVFGSGSCPANMTATVTTLGKTVTVWDWAKTCERALPLRALVLLLASFAAFLIVMPGSTKV